MTRSPLPAACAAPARNRAALVVARRTLLLAALTAGLTGCGFTLRGAPRFAFSSLRLEGGESTAVTGELRRALEGVGVRVFTPSAASVPQAGAAQVVLTVLADQRERAVVGQTAAGQVRELQLRTRFRFRLTTPQDRVLLEDTELLLVRDISFTEAAVLAKEAEEALIFRSLQSDVVQQVMRRLAHVPAP